MERDFGVEITCCHCNVTYPLLVVRKDFENWKYYGEKVQNAFPYLDAGQRELFISKTCDSCWNAMFPSEEDE